MLQFAPTANVAGFFGQLSVSENSAKFVPLNARGLLAANRSAALPVLVSVTAIAALFTPVGSDPKLIEVAERVATAPFAPVPVKATAGRVLALSLTVRLALKLPVVVGLNVIAIVQFPPAAMDEQLLGTAENSVGFVPPTIMLEVKG